MNNKKSSVPKLRFPEFTDAWEQRKLGEITKRVYGNDGRMDLPTLTMSASNGWLDQRERFSTNIAGEEQKNYTLLRRGQLSYNHGNSKLAKYGVVFELRNYEEALVPRVYHSFETNRETQATFLEYLFATKLPERELGKLVSSGARMDGLLNISYDDFMSIKVVIPKIQEQQKIGSFFTALDRLITTHQRKLENVKKLKKSLLQKMFPKNGQEFPEIRFPEFTDAWEQRKLKDFSQKVIEKNVDNKYTETLTNSAEFGIINQRDFFDKDISNATNLTSYYIVQNNDFVYNPRISNLAPVGPIKRNKLGRTGVMSPLYYVFRITDVNPTFLEIFFETSIWHRFMKENGDSGARSDRFAIKDSIFIEMPIYIPQSQEQQKIGSFFTALDRLITTHQRKLENVKNLKKALLQQMFV
ncbi:restriction endonuclease subunit S [Pasteurella sp. PK-2025]